MVHTQINDQFNSQSISFKIDIVQSWEKELLFSLLMLILFSVTIYPSSGKGITFDIILFRRQRGSYE
jgi:hypothetical protein